MVKELEILNDFVDGYLMAVYEEPEGNVQIGKSEFLQKFRTQLASVPSNKEGDELVKILNRGLLRASAIPLDASLNKRKGFEEALSSVQDKIKELFKLDNLLTGTIQQYLQDVPRILIPTKAELPSSEAIFVDGLEGDTAEKRLKEIGEMMRQNIDEQAAVMQRHLQNNGRLIIISDEGYSELNDIEKDSLKGLIEGSERSKKKLDQMLETSIALMNKFKNRNKGKGDNGPDDFLRGMFGKGPSDDE